jgi:uncharacterized protein YbjT (DUF2867 family)
MSDLLWILVALQIAMGAFDTLFHHELTERLAWRPSQKGELRLHGVRNLIYAGLFLLIGTAEPRGLLAIALLVFLAIEVIITLVDFVEEDRTRRLPASERITHTLLALNYGAILMLLVPVLLDWAASPTAVVAASHGIWTGLAVAAAAGVFVFGVRDLLAAGRSERLVRPEAAAIGRELSGRRRIVVTGATGFIGRRLVPALLDAGHDVRAMTRRPESYDGPGVPVGADVSDRSSLDEALRDVDVAIYLVHSLDDPDFERKDAEAARTFSAAAAAAGVRQIVYMGGLGDDDQDLSAHLRSRREVEQLLGGDGVPVTVLRAAIVVGHGGISWELTRQLVKNLPAMVVPKWVGTRTQPISIDDVVRYLAGVVDHPDALGRVFEIGGPDQLTYKEMLLVANEESDGRQIPIVVVPLLTPRLSSYWLALVTDVDVTTGRNLIDSMSTEVVVRDTSIRDVVPGDPLSYRESVRRALAERAAEQRGSEEQR